jgi:catechol 2,3-dioxygenase-like lactoylglutathione lyase family enzyme
MKINHLIIGCEDTNKSKAFYTEILGFDFVNSFVDTGTKKDGMVLVKKTDADELELLLVPFNEERLPSPQHLAFEVTSEQFNQIFEKATAMKLDIRSMPPLDCKIKGIGWTDVRGRKFERFYLLDPSRVNIEFMKLC